MNKHSQFINILRTKYGLALDNDVYSNIDECKAWFEGTTPWHNRTLDNGVVKIHNKIVSTSFAANVCRDRASYTISDNIEITQENKDVEQFLNKYLDDLGFRTDIVPFYERCLALGACATELVFNTYISNNVIMNVDGLDINYIQSDAIYPLQFYGNKITEVAFAFQRVVRGCDIIDLRLHLLNKDGTYRIENKRYILNKNTDWHEWTLADGDELKSPYISLINTGSKIPLFQIWRVPETDPYHSFGSNPLGVGIIHSSIDLFKQLDLAVDTLQRDTALGVPLILCSTSILPEDPNNPGRRLSPDDLRQSIYQWIPTDQSDQKPYDVFTHSINSDKIIQSIDKLVQLISDNCGLGQNFYSNQKFNKTATEILVDNSTSERTIKRSISCIKQQIKQLCDALLFIGTNYLKVKGLNKNNDINISINIEDSARENAVREILRADVLDGLVPKDVYIKRYYSDISIVDDNTNKNSDDTQSTDKTDNKI